ncbi:iron ABC transporter permease [Gordonia spumicola]|uniref:Iron ABC transporter permease n=2 Tax=Gordonia spumicola TaxID=589161 RepID=A0A7I9VDF8_9ACTN|nr:iron ABC transporter permease [Gordonia spumicola]
MPQGLMRSNRLRSIAMGVAVAAVVVLFVVSLGVGVRDIPVSHVVDALIHADRSPGNPRLDEVNVLWDQRIPRGLLALFVGAALAMSGAIIQAMTRNPLADPGILGVNAGSAFAIVVAISVFGIGSYWGYVWFALVGAAVAAVVVYALANTGRAGATPVRLALAGVALAAFLGGVTQGMVLIDSAAFTTMRFWQAGSITNRGYGVVAAVAAFVVIGAVIAIAVSRALNAVALGDDMAVALGVPLTRVRVLGVAAVTLMCGAATAAAGPIGFVGLMIPHVVRWIVGPDQRWILPFSMVGGAILLVCADMLGRVTLNDEEIPAGIITAFIGAPVLIMLARRRTASEL